MKHRYEPTCRTCIFTKGDRCRLYATPTSAVGGCHKHIPVWTSGLDPATAPTSDQPSTDSGTR